MAIRQVLMIGNEALRKKSEAIDFKRDAVEEYLRDLEDTLHHTQNVKKIGRAIAGPQIGYLKQIIVMDADSRKIVMINPSIKERSKEEFEVWDSCFSADVAFFGKTIRNKTITVEYFDENQNKRGETFEDDLSELFQHEIDHLEGILFTDRIVDNQVMMRSEWEKLSE